MAVCLLFLVRAESLEPVIVPALEFFQLSDIFRRTAGVFISCQPLHKLFFLGWAPVALFDAAAPGVRQSVHSVYLLVDVSLLRYTEAEGR